MPPIKIAAQAAQNDVKMSSYFKENPADLRTCIDTPWFFRRGITQ